MRNDTLDLGIARYFRETFNLFVFTRVREIKRIILFVGEHCFPSRVNYNRKKTRRNFVYFLWSNLFFKLLYILCLFSSFLFFFFNFYSYSKGKFKNGRRRGEKKWSGKGRIKIRDIKRIRGLLICKSVKSGARYSTVYHFLLQSFQECHTKRRQFVINQT